MERDESEQDALKMVMAHGLRELKTCLEVASKRLCGRVQTNFEIQLPYAFVKQ